MADRRNLWWVSLFALVIGTLLSASLLFAAPARAVPTDHVVISEIQTGGVGSSEYEFVELYNPTDDDVDLSSWSIQYVGGGASSFNPYKKNLALPRILARGHFLIATSAYTGSVTADLTQGTFNLSGTGGTLFLVKTTNLLTTPSDLNVVDKVAYGTGTLYAEGSAANAPQPGQSIERKPGSTAGNATDTDNNANDFQLLTTPNPQNTSSTKTPPDAPTATPTNTNTPACPDKFQSTN